jgi:cytochrome c553
MGLTRSVLSGGLFTLLLGGVAALGQTTGTPPADPSSKPSAPAPRPRVTSDEDRAAFMRQHFGEVMAIHHALVAGDLDEARKHARIVADSPDPQNLPPAAGPYLTVLHRAAGRAASADDLEDVASASAAMLAACGDCHRAVGTMPAMPAVAGTEVGGLVGHMLEHERAVDLMVQGLTVPSASAWREGTQLLLSAPLRKGDLPRDSRLTREILELEERIHELADRGRRVEDQRSRIYVYSELAQSCAACHGLHARIWGPRAR